MRHQVLLRPEISPAAAASDPSTTKGWMPRNSVLRVNRRGIFSKLKVFRVKVLRASHRHV